MDKRTVFAEGLVLPRALKVLEHGVLVGEPPNLWLMKDTNGDLKADTKDLVTDKYGCRDANVEHNANSLTWALDNWIYTSEVDMYLRLKNGQFEVRKTPARGQWGDSQDDAGRMYRNTNESVLHVDIVPTPYYGRNPNLVRTRGSYEALEVTTTRSTRCGRCTQRPASIAATRPACCARMAGSPISRPSPRRWSTAAIGFPRTRMATSSSSSPRPTWSAASC